MRKCWAGRKPFKLAALYSHPVQYVAPLFRELAAREDIDLTVYFCSRRGLETAYDEQFGVSFRWDIPLLDGYRAVFLENRRPTSSTSGFFAFVNPGIVSELIRHRYDAILIHGYEHATKWLAFAASHLSGTRIILRGESRLRDRKARWRGAVKAVVLPGLMRRISAAAYIGKANYDFYRHYGVEARKLFFAPYSVDNEFFRAEAERLKPRKEELRTQLGVDPEAPVILACGKLLDVKRPLHLLKAFQRIRSKYRCSLVYAGEGALRSRIETIVRDERIPDVTITGFLNQREVVQAYAIADVLALVSAKEQWGLVVNEAMNFGLPIVVSEQVECASNLVSPGSNGFIARPDDLETLAQCLEMLVRDAELRRRFGEQSRQTIAAYSPAQTADGIAAAVAGH